MKIDNKHRNASWESIAKEFQSERDALGISLLMQQKERDELRDELVHCIDEVRLQLVNAVAERDVAQLNELKLMAENGRLENEIERLRALLAEARQWLGDNAFAYWKNFHQVTLAAFIKKEHEPLKAERDALKADYDSLMALHDAGSRPYDMEIDRLRALLAETRQWLGDNDHEESLIRRIDAALREGGK
jgi:hypothetical protein